MKITAKSRYALRVLLDLAVSGTDSPRTIKEIAASQRISEKFISRIAVPLRRAGLVATERGVKGGLRLARFPAKITLGHCDGDGRSIGACTLFGTSGDLQAAGALCAGAGVGECER